MSGVGESMSWQMLGIAGQGTTFRSLISKLTTAPGRCPLSPGLKRRCASFARSCTAETPDRKRPIIWRLGQRTWKGAAHRRPQACNWVSRTPPNLGARAAPRALSNESTVPSSKVRLGKNSRDEWWPRRPGASLAPSKRTSEHRGFRR